MAQPVKKDLVIALDLEGTLIQDQLDPRPRPGLYQFLEKCKELGRVVMMTTVEEKIFRKIATDLALGNHAPKWFSGIEFIAWDRPYKDLRAIPGATLENSIIVDDYEPYVHPDQKENWVTVETFFEQLDDMELFRLAKLLKDLMPTLN